MNLIMIYKKKLIVGDKIFNIINIIAIIFACSETFYYSYFEIRYIIPYAAFVLMFQVIWFVAPYYYMRKNIDWFRSG